MRSHLTVSVVATFFITLNPAYLFFIFLLMTLSPFFLRWLVIAVGLVRAYLAKGSYHSLYYSIEKPLKFFQTGALLEVGPEICCCHCFLLLQKKNVLLGYIEVAMFFCWICFTF